MTGWLGLVLVGVAAGGLAGWARRRLLVITVSGTSMLPTFDSGDRLLARRHRGGRAARLRRGDVVVIRPPAVRWLPWHSVAAEPRMPPSVKRLAALPGDPVPPDVRAAVGDLDRVPAGMLVVRGDNNASTDSRTLGFYPDSGLLAVVLWRLPSAHPSAVKAL